MLVIERGLLTRCNEDGLNHQYAYREHYSHDVVLFLIFDPERGFLFERRIRQGDSLFGKTIIPAGKIRDIGERKFPLWAAERECFEEIGVVTQEITPLNPLFDDQQRNMLYPFLMTGRLWGDLGNLEPDKKTLVWISQSEIYCERRGRVEVNPMFEVETTRQVLLNARAKMEEFGINQ